MLYIQILSPISNEIKQTLYYCLKHDFDQKNFIYRERLNKLFLCKFFSNIYLNILMFYNFKMNIEKTSND